MTTLADRAADVFVSVLTFGLRFVQPLRKPPNTKPHAKMQRHYEWRAQLDCSDCHWTTWAHFIEWDDKQITATCLSCGTETDV